MSDKLPLLQDLELLCLKYNLPCALLVIPQTEAQYVLLSLQMTEESLRNLGHLLVKHIPDMRSLN